MEYPVCEYYVYSYKSIKDPQTGKCNYRRLYNKLFKAHSAAEALAFNIDFIKKCGFSRDEMKYEIIRKGTRQIAKQRGLPSCSVCTMVVSPWQWTGMTMDQIVNSLNHIDKDWDKAEGKCPINRVNFFKQV